MSSAAQPPPSDGLAATGGDVGEKRRIYVIDDDDVILLACRRILEADGCAVETFARGHAGLQRIAEVRPQLLLVDLKMPELNGLEVIQQARQLDEELVIVVITGYATIATAVDAMKAGAYDFLPKPFTPDELRLISRRALERWDLAQASRRLLREKEEAERRFVTFVSHQLKTPLVAVQQYLNVLLYTSSHELPEQAKTWLQRSQARLTEMLGLIGDWLTLAKVERGLLTEGRGTSDLGLLIDQALRAVEPEAAAAQVRVEARVPQALPRVGGDPVALATVVSNLLTNAIKYNRSGGEVLVRADAADDAVVLQVADTGIGIAPDCLPCLFTEFFRASDPRVRALPGSGLGLAICKRVVDELGGSITARSELGVGSTFELRLPLAPRSTIE